MNALGRPADLYHVAVLRLWDNHYRVNVFTGVDAVSALIADSFFVSADDRGNVVDSRPKVTRKYGPPGGSAGCPPTTPEPTLGSPVSVPRAGSRPTVG
jgi:hypothetical protein